MTPRRAPCDISDQRDHDEIADPTDPADPIDRIEAIEPTLPIDNTDPTLPMDRIDPFDPIDRSDFSDQSDQREVRLEDERTVTSLPPLKVRVVSDDAAGDVHVCATSSWHVCERLERD